MYSDKTHPDYAFWGQIAAKLVDNGPVVVTQKEFDKLLEYSCSLPSGQYLGKVWKRKKDYYDASQGWLLGRYSRLNEFTVDIDWYDLQIEGQQAVSEELPVWML